MKLNLPYLKTLFLAQILIASTAHGKSKLDLPNLNSLRPMNGINPAPLNQFWKKWNLVTTRYRKDNEEQRFIYANSIAYDAMKDGSLDFPDGAMFGKLAFLTEADPQFPNSFEPMNFTRLQIMVKNRLKFRKTNGWSYYIYVDGSNHSVKDDESKNLACHACHTLVKDRDFVFSAPTFLKGAGELYGDIGKTYKELFKKVDSKDLPPLESELLTLLKFKPKKVMVRRMRLFSGSLYESIGPLTSYVNKTNKTYAIVDPISKQFLIAEKSKNQINQCDGDAIIIHLSIKRKGMDKIRQGFVCKGKNKWVKVIKTPKRIMDAF